ncbi:MAG: pyruvate kinase [Chloroflexi bacterium]|nr:pyruvate kinase [Chloroflexota bacterium]
MYPIPTSLAARPRTRIVCTIGPATATRDAIARLINAGMSVARLNLSHGDLRTHIATVQAIRAASDDTGTPVAILTDLPGPKYRLGDVSPGGVTLETGTSYILRSGGTAPADAASAPVWPPGLHTDVSAGANILIDDGAIILNVRDVEGPNIRCTVEQGGEILPRKAVAAPGSVSTLDYFTDETSRAIDLAAEARVDFVGVSYARSAEDVRRVRARLQDAGARPRLIAKIELRQAVENLDSILAEADGVMVARGDLGVELPIADVPGAQKHIIHTANNAGKVVITATQMLESMVNSPTPTRAEATDVHNAVRDGTDAVMLSAETSIGKHPIAAVECMARIARRAEDELEHDAFMQRRNRASIQAGQGVDDAIAYNACTTAAALGAKVILAFTESGSTAGRVASFRPATPILAMVASTETQRLLALRWGVIPLLTRPCHSVQEMFVEGSRAAKETGLTRDGDLAVVVAGMPIGVPGTTNLLRVMRIPEPAP